MRLHAIAIAVAGMILMESCASGRQWEPVTNPAPDNASMQGKRVRVTRADRVQVQLEAARIEADTLRGVDADSLARGSQVEVAIPMRDVRQLEVERVNAAREVASTMGIFGVLAGVLLAIGLSTMTINGH